MDYFDVVHRCLHITTVVVLVDRKKLLTAQAIGILGCGPKAGYGIKCDRLAYIENVAVKMRKMANTVMQIILLIMVIGSFRIKPKRCFASRNPRAPKLPALCPC